MKEDAILAKNTDGVSLFSAVKGLRYNFVGKDAEYNAIREANRLGLKLKSLDSPSGRAIYIKHVNRNAPTIEQTPVLTPAPRSV